MAQLPPVRAFGRSLEDFDELLPAESTLLAQCRRGQTATIRKQRPKRASSSNRLRADFVRFLALGGDERAPIHESGVDLRGGWLLGPLDLRAVVVRHQLNLIDCRIEKIEADNAELGGLNLNGTLLEHGLAGYRLKCGGPIAMGRGFLAKGSVFLVNAAIDGDLICIEGRFDGEPRALILDRTAVSGRVFLGQGFGASETVSMIGVAIRDDLDCQQGRFASPTGKALILNRAKIGGSVVLGYGFVAKGMVSLSGASVDENLDCTEARVDGGDGAALDCDFARVGGTFFFRGPTEVRGDVYLASMQVALLADHAVSWSGVTGRLVLDGFVYGSLAGRAPVDAATRIAWLDRQYPAHLGAEFKTQPWDQLASVLKLQHPGEANKILFTLQTRLRQAGRITRGARPLHWFYGALLGYGYRPFRLLQGVAAVWLLCGLIYWAAANPRWFGSDSPLIAPTVTASAATPVVRPADYRTFSPLIYSLDVLLPVLSLGQAEEWRIQLVDSHGRLMALGQALRSLYWAETLFGWLVGLQLLILFGRLLRNN